MSTPSAPTVGPKPAAPVSTVARPNQNSGPVNYGSDTDSDGQARGGRRAGKQLSIPLPTSTGLSAPAGQLLQGATDENGKQKAAALLVGIKLDLEAEVHLTARVKGDVCLGLY